MEKILAEDLEAFGPLLEDMKTTGHTWAREMTVRHYHPTSKETGLPTLPDGYIFRVTEDYSPQIELHRRTVTERPSPFAWLGVKKSSIKVETRMVYYWTISRKGTAAESIQEAAITLLKFLPKQLQDVATPIDFTPFLGDYPPKSL